MRKHWEWKTRQVEIGTKLTSHGLIWWAECGKIYESGFKTESAAKTAITRRIQQVIDAEVEK